MDFIVALHRHIVEGLGFILLINLILPWFLRDNLIKRVFYTRIGYFAFWMFWAMAIFSGLILYIFMKQPMNLAIGAMVAISIVLPILDGYRAIKLKRIWLQEEDGLSFSLKVVSIELALFLIVFILALIK